MPLRTETTENISSHSVDSARIGAEIRSGFLEKRNRVNKDEPSRIPSTTEVSKTVPNTAPSSPSKTTPLENNEPSVPLWRRPGSFKSRATSGREEVPGKALTLRIGERESPSPKATTPTGAANRINADTPEVVLRRTQSFEADEKFRRRYMELQARIKAGSCPSLHACPVSSLPTRSASLREKHLSRRVRDDIKTVVTEAQEPPTTTATLTTTTTTTSTTLTTTVNTSPSKTSSTSPTSTSPLPGSQVRRSFVPPVRDEESETQRKAHAKRVRETRRSTQGVTLEELKSAEQLIKKRNQQQLQQLANEQSPPIISTPNSTSITATITTAVPTVPSGNVSSKDEGSSVQERRPSWRLRVDNVDRSKFLLEDARNRSSVGDTPNYIRRTSSGGSSATTRPSSAPVEGVTADTTVTIALRRQGKPPEDKEQDKENDIRNAQATQGVIQRRRRPKRRSTGVVHVDMDEIDPDRQEKLDGDIVNNNEVQLPKGWLYLIFIHPELGMNSAALWLVSAACTIWYKGR
uniref:Uncharacterized protein n=1 Tax=Timema cristinae TaxID=61476 RepID=A0A7R9GX63_TIMCR|nr:unnamed protein product [Timema cristinae]